MKPRISIAFLIAVLAFGNTITALAGGQLETHEATTIPSPIAGHVLARVIGMRWDPRSIPVKYSMNTTLDPIPNPLGAAFLSVNDARNVLQASLNQWNAIPTSYIEMQITGTTSNAGLIGFNFVNEITFRTAAGFTAIASSPSVTLIRDSTFSHGDDIDGDGDSDVSNAITVTTDVDSDGDLEFPAGNYPAGTILDNDVQFNTKTSNGLRFTIDPAQRDTTTRSVDLTTVAVHEFGHSFGLAHSMDNQTSKDNGDGATMFPFIDTGDPAAEAGQAILAQDDISWASYIYQEGSAPSGPAALQPGDVAFNQAYGVITGEIRHGTLNQPVAGASVYAIDVKNNVTASGYSGTTFLSRNNATGGLFFLPNVADGIANGNYVIPVPKGTYTVGVEAVDGNPAAPGNINFGPQIGNFYGQMNFVEEFFNTKSAQFAVSRVLGEKTPVVVPAGLSGGKTNITTARLSNINNFGVITNIGFTNLPPGSLYAMRIPGSQLTAINPGQVVGLQGIRFETFLSDASVPVIFARAMLTSGVVNPDNSVSVNLASPLAATSGFLGQDSDFSTFYFDSPDLLAKKVRGLITDGSIQELFIVLELPTTGPFPGVSGLPPLIGLSTQPPVLGRSFISPNGGSTWVPQPSFNFRFSLLVSNPVL
jgi:hypothetical protein